MTLTPALVTLQDFYARKVLVDGAECRLRINLDLNTPIPSVLPNGTLVERTEVPVSVNLGQVRVARLHTAAVGCLVRLPEHAHPQRAAQQHAA